MAQFIVPLHDGLTKERPVSLRLQVFKIPPQCRGPYCFEPALRRWVALLVPRESGKAAATWYKTLASRFVGVRNKTLGTHAHRRAKLCENSCLNLS